MKGLGVGVRGGGVAKRLESTHSFPVKLIITMMHAVSFFVKVGVTEFPKNF